MDEDEKERGFGRILSTTLLILPFVVAVAETMLGKLLSTKSIASAQNALLTYMRLQLPRRLIKTTNSPRSLRPRPCPSLGLLSLGLTARNYNNPTCRISRSICSQKP